jgi:hypothetical protein
MSGADRDLAEAIYAEMTDDDMSDAAMVFWDGFPDYPPRERIEAIIAFVATLAIDAVLARRLREAARTGPWEAT